MNNTFHAQFSFRSVITNRVDPIHSRRTSHASLRGRSDTHGMDNYHTLYPLRQRVKGMAAIGLDNAEFLCNTG